MCTHIQNCVLYVGRVAAILGREGRDAVKRAGMRAQMCGWGVCMCISNVPPMQKQLKTGWWAGMRTILRKEAHFKRNLVSRSWNISGDDEKSPGEAQKCPKKFIKILKSTLKHQILDPEWRIIPTLPFCIFNRDLYCGSMGEKCFSWKCKLWHFVKILNLHCWSMGNPKNTASWKYLKKSPKTPILGQITY